MTIKLPVAADLLETDARLAWRIVDADGVVIPWGTVVAALNATASAPDLTALREAVEVARAAQQAAYMRVYNLAVEAGMGREQLERLLAGEEPGA